MGHPGPGPSQNNPQPCNTGLLRTLKRNMVSRRKAQDPMDCEDPACKDVADILKKGRKLGLKKRAATAKKNNADRAAASLAASRARAAAEGDGCPMDKGELGAATWGLMHTTAAHYPDEPSEEAQSHARAFIASLAALYPCSYCRKDFKKEINKEPPDVGSRLALSLWTCRQHNIVNEKLGKPSFECTLPRLDERWKTGRKSCWGGEDAKA